MSLCAVCEKGNREKVVADGTLAVRKNRPGRDGELMLAPAAFPNGARRERRHFQATAFRAIRLPAVVRPTQLTKRLPCLLLGHAGNGAQAERPGLAGEEEMLR